MISGARRNPRFVDICRIPQGPSHPQSECFGSGIVGARIGLIVVVEINDVDWFYSGGRGSCLELIKEPWEEIGVVVSDLIGNTDLTDPVYTVIELDSDPWPRGYMLTHSTTKSMWMEQRRERWAGQLWPSLRH